MPYPGNRRHHRRLLLLSAPMCQRAYWRLRVTCSCRRRGRASFGNVRPGDQHGRTSPHHYRGRSRVDPAIHLDIHCPPVKVAIIAARRTILSVMVGMKLCPPKPGLTVITSTWSTYGRISRTVSSAVAGLSVTPGFAQNANRLDGAVQVRTGLHVHGDDVGAGLGEVGQERSGASIIRCTSSGNLVVFRRAATTGGPMVNVRHEMTIHHIHVDVVGPSGLAAAHRLRPTGEISGKDGWGDLDQDVLLRVTCNA